MKNKGISLITLVITIIIMIILAGVIVLTLSQSGIFNKANDAVSEYDLKQVQAIADLAWSEAYADGARDKDSLQAAVDKALTDNKLNDKYKAKADEKGVTVTEKVQGGNTAAVPDEWQENVSEVTSENVPIPKGFVVSPYGAHDDFKAENTRDGGLVIYALTPDEIAAGETDILKIDGKNGELTLKEAHYESMKTRNQFVWVPVDDFKNDFKRTEYYIPEGNKYQTPSYTLGSGYWELVLDEDNMPADNTKNTTDFVSKYTLDEAIEMYNSVEEYGGFYMARYETGEDDTGAISITMGKYPYNTVPWGTSMSNEEGTNRAVTLSRSFYPKDENNYGVVSTLVYGVQWDTTLNWWTGKDLTNSTSYGNYSDTSIEICDYNEGAKYSSSDGSWEDEIVEKVYDEGIDRADLWLLTTGAFKKANVNNIYDMAGNLKEWTMEGESNNRRVSRGSGYNGTGAFTPVSVRRSSSTYHMEYSLGFRPSLYIKVK